MYICTCIHIYIYIYSFIHTYMCLLAVDAPQYARLHPGQVPQSAQVRAYDDRS